MQKRCGGAVSGAPTLFCAVRTRRSAVEEVGQTTPAPYRHQRDTGREQPATENQETAQAHTGHRQTRLLRLLTCRRLASRRLASRRLGRRRALARVAQVKLLPGDVRLRFHELPPGRREEVRVKVRVRSRVVERELAGSSRSSRKRL